MPEQKSLIILIKTPKLGHVKTRLADEIGSKNALAIYKGFLKDIDYKLNMKDEFQTWYAITPENYSHGVFHNLLRLKHFFMQNGRNLGTRMDNAFGYLAEQGSKKIILIGSDIPEISVDIIDEAFTMLDDYDCVLGPSSDGGYYLIGLRYPESGLFQNISWSSEKVLQQTMNRVREFEKNVYLLEPLNDIDTLKDLKGLYSRLSTQNRDNPDFPKITWQQLCNLALEI